MTERRIDIDIIWEWWKTRTREEKDEAVSVLEVLSDNKSIPRAWLQMMIGGFGAQFVVAAIELFESGAFQSSVKTEEKNTGGNKMTEEKEPMYGRYGQLTPKGRRILEAVDNMLSELKEDVQSSDETGDKE